MNRLTYIWCSVHTPSKEQKDSLTSNGADLLYLNDIDPFLFGVITSLGIDDDLIDIAGMLANHITEDTILVQPAGSPAFQVCLGNAIHHIPHECIMFSHSNRESTDIIQEDGSVKKVSVFRHKGWIKI